MPRCNLGACCAVLLTAKSVAAAFEISEAMMLMRMMDMVKDVSAQTDGANHFARGNIIVSRRVLGFQSCRWWKMP
jgi:hypothetical protein